MTDYEFIQSLSQKYYRPLYLYVKRVCPNKAMTADIIQDTFLIAFQKAEELKNHEKQLAWLYRTARYRMLQLLFNTLDYDELSSIANTISDGRNYEDECIAAMDLYPEVSRYMEPEEMKLILQHYEEGYNIRELADAYHTTEASIKMKLQRAKQKLKKMRKKKYI